MNVLVSVLTIALVCLPATAAPKAGFGGEVRIDGIKAQPGEPTSALDVPQPQAGFEANNGQIDPMVRFVARLCDRTAFVTSIALVVTSAAGTERTPAWTGPSLPDSLHHR